MCSKAMSNFVYDQKPYPLYFLFICQEDEEDEEGKASIDDFYAAIILNGGNFYSSANNFAAEQSFTRNEMK